MYLKEADNVGRCLLRHLLHDLNLGAHAIKVDLLLLGLNEARLGDDLAGAHLAAAIDIRSREGENDTSDGRKQRE